MSAAGVTVDVVVPIYRPGPWIERCLRSVAEQRGAEVRLVLVDDDPATPMAADLAARARTQAVALGTDRNRGFAAAVNAGIALGDAPFVLTLNQDASIARDYLRRLVDRMEADPGLGSAAGKLLHVAAPGGEPDGMIDSAGLRMGRARRAADIGQGEPDDGRFDAWREVFGVSAAAALYRRAALEAVSDDGQIFDERFFMYKEDVDLAWRLRLRGYRAGVDGVAIGWHARGSSRVAPDERLAPALRRVIALWRQERAKPAILRERSWRNQWLMVLKNERPDQFLRALPEHLAAEAALTAVGLPLDPIATIRSRLRLLRELPAALERRRAAFG